MQKVRGYESTVNLRCPKLKQRSRTGPWKWCWIFPDIVTVSVFISPCSLPTHSFCGNERSSSKNLTPDTKCCWCAGNWRSLNKSERPVTNSHDSPPPCSPSYIPPLPTPTLFSPFPWCGNALLLFLPLCPPRWTHLKPLLYEQNKLS